MKVHPSHKTRFSMDSSVFDEICEYCGTTDGYGGKLKEPCTEDYLVTKTVSWIMKVREKYPNAGPILLNKGVYFIDSEGFLENKMKRAKTLSGPFKTEREAWEDAAKRLETREDPEREAFEARLQEDKYDGVTRLVFADWLDEHDFPEEADWQRKWTPEWQRAYDEAEDFFVKFAKDAGATAEEVLEAARRYAETGEQSQVGYSQGLGATNLWNDYWAVVEEDETRPDTFWNHYKAYTGKEAPADKGEPFHCCY